MPDKLSQIPYTPAQVLAHVRGRQGIRLRDQLGGVDWRHQRHLWRTGARPAAHALLCTLCHAVEGGRLERGRRGACKPHFDECTSPPKRPVPQCPPHVELGPSRLLNPTHCFFHSGPPILLFPNRGGHRGWGWSDGCTRRGGLHPIASVIHIHCTHLVLQEAAKRLGLERRVYTAGEAKMQLDPFLPVQPEQASGGAAWRGGALYVLWWVSVSKPFLLWAPIDSYYSFQG